MPELDLYLEMTTLRQRLVRKKNRKLRRLRELYPDLNVKLFYARDFRALMLKYGKLALHDGLSGSSGQVAAPHGATSVLTGGGPVPEAVAALVLADAVPEAVAPLVDGPASGTASATSGARRRRRPASTVGADEAIV